MNLENTTEKKYKYLTDAYLNYILGEMPTEDSISKQQVLSKRFLKRMNRLIRQAQRQTYTWGKGLLVAVIVCAILASAASVYAYRDEVKGFIVQVYESFTRIIFQASTESTDKSDDEKDISKKLPSYIPDGYELAEQAILINMVQINFKNSDGVDLMIIKHEKSGLHTGIDTEGAITDEVIIDGYKGLFVSNKGMNSLLWEDEFYAYTIIGKITKQELINMANSTN